MLDKPVNCPYLKGVIGRVNCKTCLNSTDLKVFNCSQFGRCTISKAVDGMSCCATCTLNPSNKISEEEIEMSHIDWMYGVTTVPSRKDKYLISSLTSLRDAGFNHPYLFVDGAYEGFRHIGPSLQMAGITYRFPSVGVYGNWILSLADLYIRNPRADRYCLFQDDILIHPQARQYLDCCEFPNNGYLNLFSFTPQNEVLLKSHGWTKSNQMGRGALGLVFNNKGIQDLLLNQSSLKYIVDKPAWASIRANRNVDGMVCDCLKKLDYTEYIHNPSIIQHVGNVSTIGNNHGHAKTYDPNFNLLSLIK